MTHFLNFLCFLRNLVFKFNNKYKKQDKQYYLIQNNRHREQIIFKLATDDYSVNPLQHYRFNIDGQIHIYGIVELQSIFDEADTLKNKLSKTS